MAKKQTKKKVVSKPMPTKVQTPTPDKIFVTIFFGGISFFLIGITLVILFVFGGSLFAWFFIALFGFMAYYFLNKIYRIWKFGYA